MRTEIDFNDIDTSRLASGQELPELESTSSGCEQVWSGSVGRLRVYDQPGSTGKKVFVYLEPGTNDDYVGWSDDPNMIEALFRARDGGAAVQGFTNERCRIEWMDY